MKFTLYETAFQGLSSKDNSSPILNSLGAASFTALLTTAVTYPFDLAHGRMAADMSKKNATVSINKSAPMQNKPSKLYSSVRDCLNQT